MNNGAASDQWELRFSFENSELKGSERLGKHL